MARVWPDLTAMLSQSGTGWPSSFACISAPQMAITPSRLNFSVGPMYWASSPAAPTGLPTSRLARRKDQLSIGPEGGKPWFQKPMRPG